MIYIIDHQDSFTWNIVHQFSKFDKVYCSNYFEINQKKLENSNTIVLSPGPGSPKDYPFTSKIYNKYKGKKKLIGICLGYQILALAFGAKTEKMRLGHHGANHPVQKIADGSVLITSQNHGFAVEESTLPSSLIATHKSLFDGSLQGIESKQKPAFGFQGHPEASPGPHDVAHLFDHFIELMSDQKN